MKKVMTLAAMCLILAPLLGGCDADMTTTNVLYSTSEANTNTLVENPPKSEAPVLNSENAPVVGRRFVNQTTDMTFTIGRAVCEPGQTLALDEPLDSFVYSNGAFTHEQVFMDLAELTVEDAEVLARDDAEKGYVLEVTPSAGQPISEYFLLPQGLYWTMCPTSYKLYMDGLPYQMPMEELEALYPDAEYISIGNLAYEWMDGYTNMLYCYEPLYNLKLGSSGFVDISSEGETLYGPVSWYDIESFTLLPDVPLVTDIISVGSTWVLVVGFEDMAGNEYTYLAGENGKGGDRSGLILRPLDGRILTQEEWDTLQAEK